VCCCHSTLSYNNIVSHRSQIFFLRLLHAYESCGSCPNAGSLVSASVNRLAVCGLDMGDGIEGRVSYEREASSSLCRPNGLMPLVCAVAAKKPTTAV
jgi:hypothetical protein